MKLCIVLEARFSRTPDGAVWTEVGYHHGYWRRYLGAFDSVCVIARVREVSTAGSRWMRVDGPSVSIHALPHYIGPFRYLMRRGKLRRELRAALHTDCAVILRGPGAIAGVAIGVLSRLRHPFGLEVVGDPYDVFAPGAIRSPVRPALRWWFTRRQREICDRSTATLYVTERALQARYPASGFVTFASNVELPASAFASSPREARDDPGAPLKLLFVGSLEQPYKGVDVLLKAAAGCVADGVPVQLTIVGDGRTRTELERLTAELRATEFVTFVGSLPSGDAIREQLDEADVFVLPSRTEGMPRAMIEAMARALPCVGTTVGGIPELLSSDVLLPPGEEAPLRDCIKALAVNASMRARLSAENLRKAMHFRDDILQERRLAFYREVIRQCSHRLR